MVLPERYVDDVLAVKGEREGWASVLDQLSLADFVDCGSYDRHVRRMRQRYRRRRDRLVAVLRLPPGTERSTVKAAAWQGIALDGLAEFRPPETDMSAPDGLVVGYATPSEAAYGAAVDALCGVLPPG